MGDLYKMKRAIPRVAMNNVVRIGKNKDINNYFEAVILRGQPGVYNKYGCIKLTFVKNAKHDIQYLCEVFWNWGLVIKEIKRLEEGLKVDKGVLLDDAYEITLEKIGALIFKDDSDYKNWAKKEWDKIVW